MPFIFTPVSFSAVANDFVLVASVVSFPSVTFAVIIYVFPGFSLPEYMLVLVSPIDIVVSGVLFPSSVTINMYFNGSLSGSYDFVPSIGICVLSYFTVSMFGRVSVNVVGA